MNLPDYVEIRVLKVQYPNVNLIKYKYRILSKVISRHEFYKQLVSKYQATGKVLNPREQAYAILIYEFTISNDLYNDVLEWLDCLEIMSQVSRSNGNDNRSN
jgi:hypothetical protein